MNELVLFDDRMNRDRELSQSLDNPGYVFEFALDQAVETDGLPLAAGHWRLSHCPAGERKIKGTGRKKGYYFSVCIHENPYGEFEMERFRKKGFFTAAMAYPILRLISISQSRNDNDVKISRISSYVHSLLNLLTRDLSGKSDITFGELKIIFDTIERMESIQSAFPTPSQLVNASRVQKFRFQKGCLALFGQSSQKIIQHLKMKKAFEDLLLRRKSLQQTSSGLGYRHALNFTTAFHHHFGITPTEALRSRQD